MHFAMRVAFATTYDARDPRQWSGIPSQIWKAMEALGVALDPVALDLTVDPLLGRLASASLRATKRLRKCGMGLSLTYDPSRSPILARRRAERIDDRLRLHRPDAVFSPGSTVVAKVESSVPIAFWTDAVYPAMLGFYPEFGGHSRTTMRRGMELEREALNRYSGYILATLADQDRYREIARAARDDYENRLNWAVSTRRLLELLSPDVGDEPTRRAGDGRQ
jgi:hypothetical protein